MKIAFIRPDGGLSIINPTPWWRLASSALVDQPDGTMARAFFDPPIRFENVLGRKVTQADIDARQPEWAETEREFAERIWLMDGPNGAEPMFLDDDEIPERDEFRNAWAAKGKTVAIDMEKARNIQRDILRDITSLLAIDAAKTPADLKAIKI